MEYFIVWAYRGTRGPIMRVGPCTDVLNKYYQMKDNYS